MKETQKDTRTSVASAPRGIDRGFQWTAVLIDMKIILLHKMMREDFADPAVRGGSYGMLTVTGEEA